MMDWLQKLDIATAVMLGVMGMGAWILWKVQKDPNNDFNFEDMMRDDLGRPSAFRLAIFISLAVSTWVIMYIVLKTNTLDSWIFVSYLAIWSGAKVAESAVNAYGSSKQGGYGGYGGGYGDYRRSTRTDTTETTVESPTSPGPTGRRYTPPNN